MRITFFLLLLLITGIANATDYYVSASGNDSNNGTSQATPWKSISKVESVCNSGLIGPGDRILFKCGDQFTGKAVIASIWGNDARSGTATNPVTLGSYGSGAKPTFLYPTGGSTAAESRVLFWFAGLDYWVIDGLSFTDLNTSNNKVTPANLGIPIYLGSDVGCNRWTIQNLDISLCGMGIVIVGNYNTVKSCNMSNFKNLKSTSGGYEDYGANPFTLLDGNNNTIINNYVSGGWAESLDFGFNGGFCEMFGSCSNNTFMYNTIVDCNGLSEFGANGASANSTNNLYAYNKLIDNGAMFYCNISGPFACQVSNTQFFNNVVIETNNSRFAQGSANQGAGVTSPEAISNINLDSYMFLYNGTPSASTVFAAKNNIFNIQNPLKICKSGESRLTHDYQVFKLSGGSSFPLSLASHEVSTSAAVFVNTAASSALSWDLNPLSGSVAIDRGVSVGIQSDFIGNPVPSVPNAGIYETAGAGSTLAASSVAGTIACNGGTTTVTVSASGGTSPYTGTGTFTVGAGTHTYTITDAAGGTKTTSVIVSEPTTVSGSLSAGTIAVFGGTTTLTVSASGGTPGYTYKLGTGSYQSSNTFANVLAGLQSVTIKDANGCTAVKTLTITQPSAPSTLAASATAGIIGCNGGTATVTVSATGGTSPYTGAGTFTVSAGTYNYTVTDASGASATTSITVSQPTAINLSVTPGTITVAGGTTTISCNASGGTPTFTYKLNSGSYQSSGSFSAVAAGTHTITVKDKNGCTTAKTITITQPGQSNPLAASSTAGIINCNGGNTTVTVSATGGTAPYTGTGTFTVGAGTYNYTVTDAAGASATTSVTVSQPSVIVATATAGTTTITAGATGGTPDYTYKLDNGAYQSSTSFSGVAAGAHTITVQDSKGCTATTSVTVSSPSNGVFKLNLVSKTNETCKGKKNGTIKVQCTGGTAPYQYRINFGSYSSNNYFTNLKPGFYIVTGKSATGATSTLYLVISSSSVICPAGGKVNEAGKGESREVETTIATVETGDLKVNVYPNPTTSEFSLVVEKGSQEDVYIVVTNVNGQKVFEGRSKTFNKTMFGRNFNAGIYFVKVLQGKSVQTLKLIKAG